MFFSAFTGLADSCVGVGLVSVSAGDAISAAAVAVFLLVGSLVFFSGRALFSSFITIFSILLRFGLGLSSVGLSAALSTACWSRIAYTMHRNRDCPISLCSYYRQYFAAQRATWILVVRYYT